MRIAMIGQKGIPTKYGGIERHVESLSTRLGAKGNDVLVYTRAWYAAPKKRFSKGVQTIATPSIKTKHFDAISHTLTSTIHAIRSGVDIIHYHGVGPSLLAWIPRVFAPQIKVVSTFHCIDRKQNQKWGIIARFMLGLGEYAASKLPHKTISVSRILQAYCKDRFNCDAAYIPSGVEKPNRTGTDILTKFGLKKDGYILAVARLIPSKGIHYLIDAFNTLSQTKETNGKKLVIVGDSAFTDNYVKQLKLMAAKNPQILFTGFLKGKALEQVFAGASLVVHPSDAEGLPIALLEAMSHGKTVLAADIPENMEVSREHGLHFKKRDVVDLIKKLRFAFRNPVFLKMNGATAKTFVLANYRWDTVTKEVENIYKEILIKTAAPKNVTIKLAR